MRKVRLFCMVTGFLQVAVVQLALAAGFSPGDGTVAEGEYSLSNQWQHARHRLSMLQQVLDPDSQLRITPFLKPGGHYLEVGPGLGSMTRFMAQQTGEQGRVLAVDIDSTFLEEVSATGPQVDAVQADITSYDPGAERFDFIYVRLVFLHLTQNDNQALMNKLVHSLKPGGYLFIDDFVEAANINHYQELARIDSRLPEYEVAIWRKMSGHMDTDQGYRLAEMMSEAGLEAVESDIVVKRYRSGGLYSQLKQLSWNQLEPYLRDIPDHETLFPLLNSAWENPGLHWYGMGRIYVVGHKPHK